jgi:tRNA G18 (ribose-2'-O)-methylase SpoU
MHCPNCGVRMTCRPLAVEEQLREQQQRIRGGGGASIERLPFSVVVDNVRSLWNVGAVFRSADACGVQQLVLTGITGCPPRAEITKTALGAEQAVAWSYRADPLEAVNEQIARGFVSVALETTPRSVSLGELRWPERTCLVLGNEVAGITAPVLEACRHHVTIPMYGVKNTLNVAVAFGIAAHAAARALSRSEFVAMDKLPGGLSS